MSDVGTRGDLLRDLSEAIAWGLTSNNEGLGPQPNVSSTNQAASHLCAAWRLCLSVGVLTPHLSMTGSPSFSDWTRSIDTMVD